jgi:hypothetical protein
MLSIISGSQVYGTWAIKAEETIDPREQELISRAVVVESDYGNSCCFFLKAGGQFYIPMSPDASIGVGEEVDLSKAKVRLLQKGDQTIKRIVI